jgi:hypothetical protein
MFYRGDGVVLTQFTTLKAGYVVAGSIFCPQHPAHGIEKRMKLNIGSGSVPIPGYESIDRIYGKEAYPLDVPDCSVEEIIASHILEHFPHGVAQEVLAHWVSKLQYGGCIKISVPDFSYIAQQYLNNKPINIQALVMGSQSDENDFHGTIFDEDCLRDAMISAGLERIGRWKPELNNCAGEPYSLNLLGYRPHPNVDNPTGVVAVLASARFGPALHHRCAYESFMPLGIPYHTFSGCFWHQHLSEALEDLIANDVIHYVIVCDFDTVFCKQDVVELYRLIRAYPEAHCIAATQIKRGSTVPLITTSREVTALDFMGNLTAVDTAHFGLTIFDADRLRALPRPWMQPKPGSDGRWHKDKVDADIDFWHNWKRAGNNLYVANKVIAGHMEELITWPGGIHQTLNDYAVNGIPAEVPR